MAVWVGRPGALTAPQAIPIGEYRRRLFVETQLPKLAVLLAAMALYSSTASPWIIANWPADNVHTEVATAVPREALREASIGSLAEPFMAEAAVPLAAELETAESAAPASISGVRFLAQGQAAAGPLTGSARTNALIAIELIDGYVIAPGARFSFDEVARTWDYREDPRYLWNWGTSRFGMVPMRGGGVCWVSTALWRAALWAGIPTEHRQNHVGLVSSLGIGTDATNTLVIRNDSDVPITLRAWMDDEDVNVALLADQRLDRVGRVRGPVRQGPGRYVLYQDVIWAGGAETTSAFHSGYYW